MRFVVVGNPGSRRLTLFDEALAARGLPPAVVLPWEDLIAGRTSLEDEIQEGDFVRIESPGRDFAVEKALLTVGAQKDAGDYFAGTDAETARALSFDKGEILFPRQWYRGFCRVLEMITAQLQAAPPHVLLSDPAEIACLFDKTACHACLEALGLPVPRSLGPVCCFAELTERMAEAHIRQVFIKLAHGSSASGAIAYRTDGSGRHRAVTTVEMVRDGARARLYNTRRVRALEDVGEIAALADALCPHRVHVEEWLPKASLGGEAFDLRVLMIGGEARHIVARCSRSPMTNLHLLNRREDAATVRARVGEAAWGAMGDAAEQTVRLAFPRSLHIGLDVMWTPGFRRLAILEGNAFGDLLPDVLSEGQTTYGAEINAAFRRAAACRSGILC